MNLPDKFSFSDVGGAKTNYSPVVNSNTDWDASEICLATSAIAMSSRTLDRAYVRFTMGSLPALVNSSSWDAVWRGGTATAPLCANAGTGITTITFPSLVLDEQGTQHTTNFQSVMVNVESSTACFVQAKITSANVITLYTFTSAGSANNLSSAYIIDLWMK